MPGLRLGAVPARGRAQPAGLPQVRPSHAHRRPRAPDAVPGPGRAPRKSASEVAPEDPLRFRDCKRYRDRLAAAQKAVGERDAFVVMSGTLEGLEVVAGAFEFCFMGGSMGSVVGERFVRGVEHAIGAAHAGRVLLGERRRAHAGGAAFAPADGQDERGAGGARGASACRSSRCRPTRRPAAYPRASRCSATSTSPSRRR